MEETAAAPAEESISPARRRPFLLRYLRPKLTVALVMWRIEAYSALPLAVLFIATLGRWPAALMMGCLMAVFAAVFLFLLEGEPAVEDARAWADRRWIGRLLERLAEGRGGSGRITRSLAVVPAIMLMGPFWRAVALHLFGVRRALAYAFSVGGSIPHSLFWTGVVVGGIWEGIAWPTIKSL
jgi:hypothetical protein